MIFTKLLSVVLVGLLACITAAAPVSDLTGQQAAACPAECSNQVVICTWWNNNIRSCVTNICKVSAQCSSCDMCSWPQKSLDGSKSDATGAVKRDSAPAPSTGNCVILCLQGECGPHCFVSGERMPTIDDGALIIPVSDIGAQNVTIKSTETTADVDHKGPPHCGQWECNIYGCWWQPCRPHHPPRADVQDTTDSATTDTDPSKQWAPPPHCGEWECNIYGCWFQPCHGQKPPGADMADTDSATNDDGGPANAVPWTCASHFCWYKASNTTASN